MGTQAVHISSLIEQLQSSNPDQAQAARSTLQQQLLNHPQNPALHLGMGIAEMLAGKIGSSRQHFETATHLNPKFGSAWSNLGNIHKLQGRLKLARECYDQAIAVQPDLADAHFNMAQVDEAEGNLKAAEQSVRRALLFRPGYPEAHNNLGRLLIISGKVEQAVSHFRQALGANPQLRQARDNLIMSLYRLGRSNEAQAEVDQLLQKNPDDVHVLRVQAAGLAQQGRLDDAESVNRKLLSLQPDAPDLQWNLGEVMLQREDYEGALACYKQLLSQNNIPAATAIGAMANVMFVKGNFSEARNLFQQALALDANQPRLLIGLSRALLAFGETRQGLEILRRATQLLPQIPEVHAQLIQALRVISDQGQESTQEAKTWLNFHAESAASNTPQPHRKAGQPLRLGLLVGDLEKNMRAAQVLRLLAATFKASGVECSVYQTLPAGPHSHALQEQFDHWRPAAGLGQTDLAQQIKEDGVHLLLDMIGSAPGCRLQTLALRPAAAQWSWLGDFTGALPPLTDGLLGSCAHRKSEENDTHLITLPATAPFEPPHDAPNVTALPAKARGVFTLGVLAPLAQIQPQTLDAWGAILREHPGARLLLLSHTDLADSATRSRIQRLMLLRDVEPERIEVLPRLHKAEYWQALTRMDMVLDTFPLPGDDSAVYEALWMGLPVVSRHGDSPWQRTSLSALQQVGLDNWSVDSVDGYIAQAGHAMSDLDALETIRLNLRHKMSAAPCMDTDSWKKAFHAALDKLMPASTE